MYISLTGIGQRPNQPKYLDGSNCMWAREIESQKVITMDIAKSILVESENIANKQFGFEHKFFKVVIEISKSKKVSYNSNDNCLTVWDNDLPIYQNCNGIICRDVVALADSIL